MTLIVQLISKRLNADLTQRKEKEPVILTQYSRNSKYLVFQSEPSRNDKEQTFKQAQQPEIQI